MKRLLGLVLTMFSFLCIAVFAKENQRPKVSVVIPVYKVEPWIRECMDNLVNQTLKEIEIICVDDGSPDNCGAILDEYAKNDKRVKVIHQENGGVQKARNAGLDAATGEYIALLDSDDYVDTRAYETAYELAKKDNVDILNFKARIFDDGKDDHINKIDFSDAPVVSAENYIQNNYRCWVWDNLFKNEIIQKDKIRFIQGIKPADDTCFTYMALGRAKKVKSIPATFYNYRIRPCALSSMSSESVFINSYKMFKYICDSWRSGNCLHNNEHNLITLIVRWARIWGSVYLKHAQEILDSFGSDVYNSRNVAKCPDYVQKDLKKLEYSAAGSKNIPLENGIYRISTASSGYVKRLDISEGSVKDGAAVQQWEPNFTLAQDFEITRFEEGYYTIKSVRSGKMLDVCYAEQKPGTKIHQWEDNNSQAQHWYIVPCGDGNFNIISECNLLAMDVTGNKGDNGTKIQCWELNGTNAQKFKFLKKQNKHLSNENPISIALATDSNYVYPAIVTMTSVLENRNSSNTKIDFYVMISGNFDQDLKDKLFGLEKKYSNCKVSLIDMNDKMKSLYTSRHIVTATYYRLMLPSLLPNLDKILYIDADTLVQKDLTELFNCDLTGYYIAGVLDGIVPIGSDKYTLQQHVAWQKGYNSYEEVLNIPDMDQYVNAGVCLFNLKSMREDNIEEKLLKTAGENKFEWHDQDTLNVVCYGKIKILPLKYNVMSHYIFENNADLHSAKEINIAKTSPCIIHYTANKPWQSPFAYPQSSLWWKCAEKTDCFEKLQEKYLIEDGIYVVSSALDNNMVLDISGGSKKNGANLQLWKRNSTDAQKFNIKYAGERCFSVVSKCSNKAVDVCGGRKEIGTNVWQYEVNRTDAQKWYIVSCGNGYYEIISKCNGLTLDVEGGKTKMGTNIRCWESNGTNAQRFKLEKVG